jgi:glutamate synthase domain-containing protein 3
MIQKHLDLTGSPTAKTLLGDWEKSRKKFVKVFPHEYRRVLLERAAKSKGGDGGTGGAGARRVPVGAK